MKRLLTCGVVGVSLLTSAMALAALTTPDQKLGYALGAETGKSFKAHSVTINTQTFAEGMKDAMNNAPLKMTDAQIEAVINDFQKQAMQKMAGQMRATGQENQKKSDQFLALNAKKAGVKTTASGLQYKVLTEGTGPKPTATQTVTVDYEGRLIDGKVFDSSYQRGKPVSFALNAVIPGWTEGLQLMPVGSTYELFIPAKLAYGERGAPGAIGPNEALIFKVHLISAK